MSKTIEQTIADFLASAAQGWVTTPRFNSTISVVNNEVTDLQGSVADLSDEVAALEIVSSGVLTPAEKLQFTELTDGSFTTLHQHSSPGMFTAYGELYVNNDASPITVNAGSTYTKASIFTHAGLAENITTSTANSNLVIETAGVYRITADFSTYAGTNGILLTTALFLSDNEIPNAHLRRKFGNASDVSYGHMSTFVSAEVGDTIDVRCYHDNLNPVTLNVVYANLGVTYVGPQ
jgi:hypothetical protein